MVLGVGVFAQSIFADKGEIVTFISWKEVCPSVIAWYTVDIENLPVTRC